jgi:hypothetical protein
MPLAIRQVVTVQAAGVLEVRSPDLRPGDQAEVTVVVTPKSQDASQSSSRRDWRDLAGAINSSDPHGADNERIDADLANEYYHGGGGSPEAKS